MLRAPARNAPASSGFARAAAEELVTMQSFVALLEQERNALGTGKVDALPGLSAEKNNLMDILSRCADQRARLLGDACIPNSAAGVQYLLEADHDAREIWDNLIEVARRAEELNTANSYLVNQGLARVERAMDAMAGGAPGLYGTTGLAAQRRPGASRSLAHG